MSRSAEVWLATTEVTRCYQAGDPDRALRVAADLLACHPDRLAALSQLRAELLVELGRRDDAVATARAVLESGRWWSDRQVASLEAEGLDLGPAARTLRERAARAVATARASGATVAVREPASSTWATVLALHMYGVPAAETLEVWAPVTARGIRVVTVESTLTDGDGYPCWDLRELAVRDVRTGVAAAPGDAPLVLAGASQGAGVAASVALNGEARCEAWVAVVGAPQPGLARMERLVPGCLVVGGDDPLPAANQRVFRDAVLAAGGRCRWDEVAGLGHDYPQDWADRAPGILDALLTA